MKMILFRNFGGVAGSTAMVAVIWGLLSWFGVLTLEGKQVSVLKWLVLSLSIGVGVWVVQVIENAWHLHKWGPNCD